MATSTRNSEETHQTSLRVTTQMLEWMKAESERRGGISFAMIMTEALEGVKTYFKQSPQDIEVLEREAARLGFTHAEHINHIVTAHRTKLIIQEATEAGGAMPSPTAPPARHSGSFKKKS